MALENKLGLTSSADLAREEERISKKKAMELFEKGILEISLPASFLHCKQSINTSLRIFTTVQANSELSILQKAISVLCL